MALAQSATTYVVQPGDTLYRISRAHDLTVDRAAARSTDHRGHLHLGRADAPADRPRADAGPGDAAASTRRRRRRAIPRPQLDTPRAPRVEPRPSPRQTPRVERPSQDPRPSPRAGGRRRRPRGRAAGETLFRIALRYDTSVDDLRRLNGIDGDQIEIGQRLVVGGGRDRSGGRPAPRSRSGRRRATGPSTRRPSRPTWSTSSSPARRCTRSPPRSGLERRRRSARLNTLSTAPLAPGTLLRLPVAVNPALAARAEMGPADEDGLALVYPDVMRGRPTESGEPYDPLAFTVSHRDLPFGTVLLITNPASGRSTFARVTDRGPVSRAYLVELSAAAATALGARPECGPARRDPAAPLRRRPTPTPRCRRRRRQPSRLGPEAGAPEAGRLAPSRGLAEGAAWRALGRASAVRRATLKERGAEGGAWRSPTTPHPCDSSPSRLSRSPCRSPPPRRRPSRPGRRPHHRRPPGGRRPVQDACSVRIDTADLRATLAEPGPYTLFAPTDSAFADLAERAGVAHARGPGRRPAAPRRHWHAVAADAVEASVVPSAWSEHELSVTSVDGVVRVDSATVVDADRAGLERRRPRDRRGPAAACGRGRRRWRTWTRRPRDDGM